MDTFNSLYTHIKPTLPIIIFIVYLGIEALRLGYKNGFDMDSKPLTEQYLFWASLRVPIISFIWFGCFAWSNTDLSMDAEGYNNFLNASKLPLGLLSLSIPFAVIVNNIHRTIQTDKQIKEAEKKNNVDFFYAHRKNTIEVFQNYETLEIPVPNSTITLEFKNCYSTYRRCFPHASTTDNDFNSSMSFIKKAEIIWCEICTLLNKKEPNSYYGLHQHILDIEKMLSALHKHYGLKDIITKQLYLSSNIISYPVDHRNDVKHMHFTKFQNESDIKKYIKAYWHLHLSLIETLNQTLSKEFKAYTKDMVCYSVDNEYKYQSFHVAIVMEESTPTIRLV